MIFTNMMLHFLHFFLVETCDVFSAVFSKHDYSWERQPSVHFKKYFLLFLMNAEKKKILQSLTFTFICMSIFTVFQILLYWNHRFILAICWFRSPFASKNI